MERLGKVAVRGRASSRGRAVVDGGTDKRMGELHTRPAIHADQA